MGSRPTCLSIFGFVAEYEKRYMLTIWTDEYCDRINSRIPSENGNTKIEDALDV